MAKLIKANVIRESHYPDWLANIVVAPNKGDSGEYVLTLPTSTRLVQKTTFHYPKLISLLMLSQSMNFLALCMPSRGYNQIKMHPPDV